MRSAEEGYVLAQHNLGLAYHEGVIFKKNDFRALAWFREAIRNGNAPSYYNAGKLLIEGDESQLPRNKLFAFLNFLGAYYNGALFLDE